MDDSTLNGYLHFIQEAEKLKDATRSAHTRTGRHESAAEHSWRLALMAMVFEDEFPEADPHKVLRLCLVHDLGEALGGDIPAVAQHDGHDKSADERRDFEALTSSLDEGKRRELLALWEEYDAAQTPEARLVKGLDKLETLVQHNQGLNPPDFDYEFNLHYGQKHTNGSPLLERLRRLVDATTAERTRQTP